MPITAISICSHATVMLLLGDSLRMTIMMQAMVILLVVVMALLLLKPRGFLGILLLVREDMLIEHICE